MTDSQAELTNDVTPFQALDTVDVTAFQAVPTAFVTVLQVSEATSLILLHVSEPQSEIESQTLKATPLIELQDSEPHFETESQVSLAFSLIVSQDLEPHVFKSSHVFPRLLKIPDNPFPKSFKKPSIPTEKPSAASFAEFAASAASLADLSVAVSVPDVSHVSKLDFKSAFTAPVDANDVLLNLITPNVNFVMKSCIAFLISSINLMNLSNILNSGFKAVSTNFTMISTKDVITPPARSDKTLDRAPNTSPIFPSNSRNGCNIFNPPTIIFNIGVNAFTTIDKIGANEARLSANTITISPTKANTGANTSRKASINISSDACIALSVSVP